ncbi:MAG: dockerin type I domain-containing protein [Ruminococcus sp.]|nr:dockerin type I domain-containing protein [Ruminococcus sp.]MCC8110150.1 dockerin type I domain-containing protein [Ruminococcus sp.]
MKKKKLAAIFAAVAIAATPVSTLTASAENSLDVTTTTIYGDINSDGSITLSDSVAFEKVLNGQYTLSDYTVADLNVNYVVDAADKQILLAFLMQVISTLPYTG